MPTASEDTPGRSDFPWSTRVVIDAAQGRQRHVDNVALASAFNDARLNMNNVVVARMQGEHYFSEQMIVRIATDFAAEVHYQPMLEIRSCVSHLGRTSYEIDMGIFVGEKLAVRCRTTNVWMNGPTPYPLSDEARGVLRDLAD